ncbi:hypothetical protein RRG08_063303 [Elysia crispata]|uniref:Uncharacterized protein n=1 Tax=Elysia crispata TaxID=231223 RepID=A0AAE0ZW56_9GAST|nr:hypothetical protein RRG08_063303 [Elysia crispata]
MHCSAAALQSSILFAHEIDGTLPHAYSFILEACEGLNGRTVFRVQSILRAALAPKKVLDLSNISLVNATVFRNADLLSVLVSICDSGGWTTESLVRLSCFNRAFGVFWHAFLMSSRPYKSP